MIRQLLRSRRRQILLDVSTQKDLFLGEGNALIRNHRRVLANIRRMVAWARHNSVPIISTCEIYPDTGAEDEDRYCIDGTEGQKKIRYTLLSNRAVFGADDSTDMPIEILRQYDQVILNKRSIDPFEEPRIERLLTEVRADEFVIIGACTETAVMAAALGLLQRGKKVKIVTDAIGSHDIRQARLALRKMEAKGAKLIETKKLAGTSHLKLVGICHCNICSKNQAPIKVGV